jgi:heat shock protein HslJ
MKKLFLTLFVISLTIYACAAQESSEALIGAWKLASYGPSDSQTPAVPDTEAGLTFKADGTVTGHSGCNGLGGDYTVEGDQITFGEFVSTLIACEDPIMSQEGVMHQVLTDTATFKIEGNILTLTNNDMVLVLTR